jgi:4-hydroxybenzoate polyprenyltransferase
VPAASAPLRGLVVACHPLPCLAVTAFVAGWAVSVGLPAGRVLLVAVAVLLGQLSIGWCNDAVDAPLDVAAGRRDKPVVMGLVSARLLWVAAGVALAACAVASLALGVAAGVVHLVAVASGWVYDLWLKPTVLSPLPYAVAFGLLPAVPTLAASPAHWPAVGVLAGGALLGTGAHFANTVGDVEQDAATGVRGLPQRIGPSASLRASAVLVALAALALLTAHAGDAGGGAWAFVLLVAGAVLAVAGAVLGGRMIGRGRAAFRLTLAAVALVVVGFLLGGST